MCIILDTHCVSKFNESKVAREWVKKNGKIAYAYTERFRSEWKGQKYEQLRTWAEKGTLKEMCPEKVEKVAKKLEAERKLKVKGCMKSGDTHIIALAMVSGAKLLMTGDTKLRKDFKNKRLVGGKIYQGQQRLLMEAKCP